MSFAMRLIEGRSGRFGPRYSSWTLYRSVRYTGGVFSFAQELRYANWDLWWNI